MGHLLDGDFLTGKFGDLNKINAIQFGYNADVNLAWEDVTTEGGIIKLPAAAGALHLVSNSVEDDPDKGAGVPGTGIHSVTIYYLDSTYAEKSVDVALNGAAAVTTSVNDIFRINKVIAKTTGTGGAAAGTITLKDVTDTDLYGQIKVGETNMLSAAVTVPLGKKLLLTGVTAGSQKNDGSVLGMAYIRVVSNYNIERGEFLSHFTTAAYFPIYAVGKMDFDVARVFPAGSVVKLQAYSLAINFFISGTLEGVFTSA